MSDQIQNISESLYDYMLNTSLREPDVLRRLRERTAELPDSQMQISALQGQFMALLVKLMGARNTLEVGVYTGYSSLAVALALPENGRVVACDISSEYTDIAKPYWQEAGVLPKIDLRLAPALETLDALIDDNEEEGFDFAFIDADKENYSPYYERCLQLIRPGGVILVDNVLWNGAVVDESKQDVDTLAIRQFNQKLHHDDRVDLSLLPLADGITIARKR